MSGLDVHILIHPATPKDWVTQCLDSVHEAADRTGFPVAVHRLPAVVGHIGQGRAKGYALGVQPYVTSVDDDDWVAPDAFAVLGDALVAGPAAITTTCMAHQNGCQWTLASRDNLRVFRRDVAAFAPLADWPVYDGPMMLAHARAAGDVLHVGKAVYHYRLHLSPHRKLIAGVDDAMRARIRALPRAA